MSSSRKYASFIDFMLMALPLCGDVDLDFAKDIMTYRDNKQYIDRQTLLKYHIIDGQNPLKIELAKLGLAENFDYIFDEKENDYFILASKFEKMLTMSELLTVHKRNYYSCQINCINSCINMYITYLQTVIQSS